MYSSEVATRICQELIEGKSLRTICAADGMPAKSTVLGWLQGDAVPGFLDQYTRARELQAESLLDEILEIADDDSEDTMMGGMGGTVGNPTAVSRARVKIDSRKWAMAKLAPKKYGDKLALTDGDGKPLAPPEIRVYAGAPPLANSEKEIAD
jgi:hypothetical protein